MFSRGDRRLADVILAAYRLGCRFDGWSDECRWELWERAFAERGLDPAWYHRRRTLDEVLPWDHIDSGVSKLFLQRELAAAFARTLTPDCSIERCTYCGEQGDRYTRVVPDRERPGRRLELCRACGGFLKTLDVEVVTPFPLLAIEDLASSDLDQAAVHHKFKRLPLKRF